MGSEVPAKHTPITKDELIAAYTAWFARVLPEIELSVNTIPILVAHSAFETGEWAGMMNFNVGNFKKLTFADYTYFTTEEDLPIAIGERALAQSTPAAPCEEKSRTDKIISVWLKPKHPGCAFAAYSSLDVGVDDFLRHMRSRFMVAMARATKGDCVGYVTALKDAKYFTGPLEAYIAGVSRFVDRWGTPLLDSENAILDAVAVFGVNTIDGSSSGEFELVDPKLPRLPSSGCSNAVKSFQALMNDTQAVNPPLDEDGTPGPLTKNAIRMQTENPAYT